ncbi:MAG: hypothetical protein ACRER9_09180, partial [Gammaproteobacteria bacterium]
FGIAAVSSRMNSTATRRSRIALFLDSDRVRLPAVSPLTLPRRQPGVSVRADSGMPILAKVLIAAMLLMASALGNTESRWQNLRAVQAAERQFIGLRLPPGIKVLHDLHYGAVATRSRAARWHGG